LPVGTKNVWIEGDATIKEYTKKLEKLLEKRGQRLTNAEVKELNLEVPQGGCDWDHCCGRRHLLYNSA
jgi:hypothetical protein